jgi:hypothetical protein
MTNSALSKLLANRSLPVWMHDGETFLRAGQVGVMLPICIRESTSDSPAMSDALASSLSSRLNNAGSQKERPALAALGQGNPLPIVAAKSGADFERDRYPQRPAELTDDAVVLMLSAKVQRSGSRRRGPKAVHPKERE